VGRDMQPGARPLRRRAAIRRHLRPARPGGRARPVQAMWLRGRSCDPDPVASDRDHGASWGLMGVLWGSRPAEQPRPADFRPGGTPVAGSIGLYGVSLGFMGVPWGFDRGPMG